LGGIGRDRRKKIIFIRTDSQIIRRGEKDDRIGFATGNIGNGDGTKFPEERRNIAGKDFVGDCLFALYEIKSRNLLGKIIAARRVDIARRQRKSLRKCVARQTNRKDLQQRFQGFTRPFAGTTARVRRFCGRNLICSMPFRQPF
jgi:hypothetical protein